MSETLKRVLVGAVGVPLILVILYFGGIYFFELTLLLQALCLYEFYSIFKAREIYPLKTLSIIVSLLISAAVYFQQISLLPFFILIPVLFISIELFRKDLRIPLNPLLTIAGYIYITMPFILLNFINGLANFNPLIYIVVLIWVCDTFAYFGGKRFGKHKLSSISPNKTIEGSVIGFIFTIAASLIYRMFIPSQLSLVDAVILGTIIGIFGQFGDLFESLLKRYTKVKDSSNIIPGHGGVLDRFDSLIFVAPFVFIYFTYFK